MSQMVVCPVDGMIVLPSGFLKEDRSIVYLAEILLVDNTVFSDKEVRQKPFDESSNCVMTSQQQQPLHCGQDLRKPACDMIWEFSHCQQR